MSSKTQGKTGLGGLPCALSVQKKLPCPLWAGLPTAWTGERLLLRDFRLEAVSDGKIPLDQSTDLLDHQVGVLRERAQHIVECLKGRESVQKAFHLTNEWKQKSGANAPPAYA